MDGKRVLYISDSLGTPIHPRGIYNYSVALVEMLKTLGANVTLLVERTNNYGLRKEWFEGDHIGGHALEYAQTSEVYRYFINCKFGFDFAVDAGLESKAREVSRKTMYELFKNLYHNCEKPYFELDELGNNSTSFNGIIDYIDKLSFSEFSNFHIHNLENDFSTNLDNDIVNSIKASGQQSYKNFFTAHYDKNARPFHSKASSDMLDIVPEQGKHLRLFDGFLAIWQVYSLSFTRAANFFEPYHVDCADYDYVFIDTPHYVALDNVDPDRTFLVLHDMIPLRDPYMAEDWRRLFIQKLDASLRTDPNVIFVSEYTKRIFHEIFPHHNLRSERIIYPSIRKNLLAGAQQPQPETTRSLTALAKQKEFEWTKYIARQIRAEGKVPRYSPLMWKKLSKKTGKWDRNLPYFATTVSDEPRKNIAALVQAFDTLLGVANIIIIGQIDKERYIGSDNWLHPNIHFTGYITDDEKNGFISHSAGLIFPSFAEGFGIPVMEGALYGRPVICSSIEVFKEVVDTHALFFVPEDPSQLCKCIVEVLNDQPAAERRAAAARDYVLTKFSQTAMRNVLRMNIPGI